MPNMTNAKSAPVLDSADAELAKLDWILFKQEQDARLFAPKAHEDDWVPGDNMYAYPRRVRDEDPFSESAVRVQGNCVRFMIELFDVNVFHAEGMDEWDEIILRCGDCEVDWPGDEPCFVCGEEREPYKARMPNLTAFGVDPNCRCIACQFGRRELTALEYDDIRAERMMIPEIRTVRGGIQYGTITRASDETVMQFAFDTGPNFSDLYRRIYSQADFDLVSRMIQPMRDTFVSVMGEVAQEANQFTATLRRALVGLPVQESQETETLCPVTLGFDVETTQDGAVIVAAIRDRNGIAYVVPEREETRRTESPWGYSFLTTRRITRTDIISIPRVVDYEPDVPLPVMSAVRTELPDRRYPTSQSITERRRERYER